MEEKGKSVIKANVVDKRAESQTENIEINLHIGVFFDGTNNNATKNKWTDWLKFTKTVAKEHATNKDYVIPVKSEKYSNVAILYHLFSPLFTDDSKNRVFHLYIEGSGANEFQSSSKIVDFIINGKAVKGLGFGLGPTGVVAKVSKALNYIYDHISLLEQQHLKIKKAHFYIYGFSRGATCARLFSSIIAQNGLAPSENAQKEFNSYLRKKLIAKNKIIFLPNMEKEVSFLGIYDTVTSIGFLKEEDGDVNGLYYASLVHSSAADFINPIGPPSQTFWQNFHKGNVRDYALNAPQKDKVKNTCHLCALDEFRANFAITEIGKTDTGNSIELFMPGCHSDVGGGYIDDEKETKTLFTEYEEQKTFFPTSNKDNSGTFWNAKPLKTALTELGWLTRNEMDTQSKSKVTFTHMVKAGYSNIPLNFMRERTEDRIVTNHEVEGVNRIFEPIDCNYNVDENGLLGAIKIDIQRYIKKTGQHFYFPDGCYNSDTYVNLRKNYLHFTSTDKMHGLGDIGNAPGRKKVYDKNIICRLAYYGEPSDDNVHYLQQEVSCLNDENIITGDLVSNIDIA